MRTKHMDCNMASKDSPKLSSFAETLLSLQTRYTPDTLEWCPVPCYHHLLGVGGYELLQAGEKNGKEGKSRRVGNFAVYKCSTTEESDELILEKAVDVDSHGILDMKWYPSIVSDSALMTTVQSNGDVVVYCVQGDSGSYKIERVHSCQVQSDGLCLSLDWNCRIQKCNPTSVCVSDSKGFVSLLQFDDSGSVRKVSSVKGHRFESWSAAFDYWNPSVLYSATDVHCTSLLVLNNTALALPSLPAPHPINLFVIDPSSTGVVGVWDGSNTNTELTKPVIHCYTDIGGDDSVFCMFDVRQLNSGPTAVDRRTHEMGVSAIQSHPLTEHLLFTGSYDESLRLWDTRNIRCPLHSHPTGGGVWRIKPHPQDPSLLLLANMYNGFKVLRIQSDSVASTELLVCCGETQTKLSYGCDWKNQCVNGPQRERSLFSTCTFYDKTLRVCELKLEGV